MLFATNGDSWLSKNLSFIISDEIVFDIIKIFLEDYGKQVIFTLSKTFVKIKMCD